MFVTVMLLHDFESIVGRMSDKHLFLFCSFSLVVDHPHYTW